MCFVNYGLRKMWLDKCVKNAVSEDPCTRNIVNCPKHSYNLDDGNFTIFFDHSEHNSVEKSVY